MTNSRAFLVKPKAKFWNKFGIYIASRGESLNIDYQIYVPEKFVLGHFMEGERGFTISPIEILYRDSAGDLKKYQELINEKELVIVKPLLLPKTTLELLALDGKEYVDATRTISETMHSILIDIK